MSSQNPREKRRKTVGQDGILSHVFCGVRRTRGRNDEKPWDKMASCPTFSAGFAEPAGETTKNRGTRWHLVPRFLRGSQNPREKRRETVGQDAILSHGF